DQRLALGEIARMSGAALGFLSVAAASRDDFTALEESIGNRHGFLKQSTGIVAQVDDEALQLVGADLRGQVADFPLQAFRGLLVEGGDADVTDVVAFDTCAHRADVNVVAYQ